MQIQRWDFFYGEWEEHDSFIERNQVNGLRERYRWADA